MFNKDTIVMAVFISMVGWGGIELVAVKEAVAIHSVKQGIDDKVNAQVGDILPVVESIQDGLIDVKCMLKYSSEDTANRLACLD